MQIGSIKTQFCRHSEGKTPHREWSRAVRRKALVRIYATGGYFLLSTLPVVAFTYARYPDLSLPHVKTQTGAPNLAAFPSAKPVSGLSGFFFSQADASAAAAVYAASESVLKSES